MRRTVVLDVVGLSRSLLGEHTPNLNAFAGNTAVIEALVPAVTCSMQTTYLTGKLPSEHGIVGNGWYFRDLGEIMFWRQSNRLVQSDRLWEVAKRRDGSFTCANTFWWYAMNSDVDWSVTPRPLYCADGRKIPDCYTAPLELRHEFSRDFGPFPLFKFWGPATSIESSEWIAKAAVALEEKYRPTLQLVYLPHLDYCLQKSGPQGDIAKDLREIDALCGRLIDFFRNRGCRVVVLSEYGITQVSDPVHPNRILRDAGLLSLKTDLGLEYLEPYTSRAFAVADHQVAHVYIREPRDIQVVKQVFAGVEGIECIIGPEEKRGAGLDHERSGEIVLVSKQDRWFTYYWWKEDAKAPDYARTVNIHAKPGYDPCELFVDPSIRFPKAAIGLRLARKLLGFRYLMDVIPLDPSLVMGSHGRVADCADKAPVFMTSEPALLDSDAIKAVDVFDLLLKHVFVE